MRKFVLVAVLVLMAGGAQASSYLDIFGVVHDTGIVVLDGGGDGCLHAEVPPIGSGIHPYSGPNLQPDADLTGADLGFAWLYGADLTGANLSNASLSRGHLYKADLSGANLFSTNLLGVNLADANLNGTLFLGTTIGTVYYDVLTDFTNAWADNGTTPFDPVAAGWNLVPEPNTALLLGLGLAGIAARRRV